jgi:hypothetical protein
MIRNNAGRLILAVVTTLASGWVVPLVANPIAPYAGLNVSSTNMASGYFGPQVASLNVRVDRPTYSFGTGAFRSTNVITQVFRADRTINLGSVTLHAGDYTFAYTIDLKDNPFSADGSLDDFQLNAMVSDFGNPDPAEVIALGSLLGAGYSTNSEFGPHNAGYLQAYPVGASTADYSVANQVQFDWPTEHPLNASKSGFLQPKDKGLVLLFADSTIAIREIGRGAGAVGALLYGGGSGIEQVQDVPVLIPVVPEPITWVLLAGAGLLLLGTRRRRFSHRGMTLHLTSS